MKNLSDYVDDYRMVVSKFDRDGGDSCAHGCAILYAAVREDDINTEAMLGTYTPKLEVDSGLYCRHPDKTKWYSRNDTFSRDQLTPLLLYLSLIGQTAALRRLFKAHLKHLLCFAWNTRQIDSYPGDNNYVWKIPDPTGPDIWSTYIRGFGFWILYPVLPFFDIFTLLGSIIYRLHISSSTIQMNHILMVDFSNEIMPTPISWLAKKIYGKKIPITALNASWGAEWQPPVNDYLTRLIEENW